MSCRVYDFDKTIYRGDATADFHRRCMRKYPRVALDVLLSCWGLLAMQLGLLSKTRGKARFYRFLRFIPDIDAEVNEFWAHNMHKIKRWYLEGHRDDDLVISASPEFLLTPACERLHARLIASRIDKRSGRAESPNCYGEEKRRRFQAEYPDLRIEAFYSDSRSDAPLAKLAEKAFLVRGERLMPW